MEIQQAFRFEFAQFCGESAAVHGEVIGQLLAVEGNIEDGGLSALGFGGKIGEELLI